MRKEVNFLGVVNEIDSSFPKNSVCWVELSCHPVLAARIFLYIEIANIFLFLFAFCNI